MFRVAILVALLFASGVKHGWADETAKKKAAALELFEQRIMPIFRSPRPSSCVQCHLAAVDLKNYILPSHEKTFLSMRDQGLIDTVNPAKSKILKLIRMGDKDEDEDANLIHAITREAELEAFEAWIEACCNDQKLRSLPKLDPKEWAKAKPDPIIRHARKSRVVESFVRNVWSQRMRCFPCHTPHDIDGSRPNAKKAIQRAKEFEKEYGAKMNIFKKTPEATLDYLIQISRKPSKKSFPMINLKNPRKSLLVLKPTAKLPKRGPGKTFAKPSSIDPISHMGGLKMHKDDQSYKSFLAWIGDYSNVVGDRYAAVKDLPADNWFPTRRILKLAKTPKTWKKGTPVQLFVYPWQPGTKTFSKKAAAFTQGTVTPRGRVNGALFLLGTEGHGKGKRPTLPRRGKFLIRAYVDRSGQLEKNPAMLLGKKDFAGEMEVNVERWPDGFKLGALVSAQSLKKK